MPQSTPQFTPQQLLDAGHRAEVEGRFDFADQFYRHVTDYHAHSSQAAEARAGLDRMGTRGAPFPIWQSNGAAPLPYLYPKAASNHASHGNLTVYRNRYRAGRLLAFVLAAAGWLTVAGGALMVAAGTGGHLLPPLPFLPSLQIEITAELLARVCASLAAGAILALAGHAAKALFDQANATRELLAIERAKAGPAPQP